MDLSQMKIFLVIIGFIGGILLIAFLAVYYLHPLLLIRFGLWYKCQKTGMKIKYVKSKDYTFCYSCRGTPGPQPSMLFLHGFTASKDMWLDVIKCLPKDLHIICVDMPGHGDTTRLEGDSYTGTAQVARIHQFVECVGLNRKPFHLVGISMGGMVAGVYAACYPSEVGYLSLFCPSGLRSPTVSEYIKRIWNQDKLNVEDNPLIPSTVKQMIELITLGLYQVPKILNTQFLKAYLDYQKANNDFFRKCFVDITSEESRFILQDNLNKIKAPLQVIWGKDDKVLDPSGAEVLAAAFPSYQIQMLEKCGHFVVGDRPRKSAKLLMEFYNSIFSPTESKKLA
ncbi:monoacylglycerol lipase ABHD6-like [Sceloporus undulatus]|uniref:monoacylglycerol lipase ABHD6-like n=1 Tax=Sceloporus undulatus TaxID=8520 RepID=UPI001C4C9267|nr:monoacylglycerol lipase ABHD6-like [Sceloporus undulatus]